MRSTLLSLLSLLALSSLACAAPAGQRASLTPDAAPRAQAPDADPDPDDGRAADTDDADPAAPAPRDPAVSVRPVGPSMIAGSSSRPRRPSKSFSVIETSSTATVP